MTEKDPKDPGPIPNRWLGCPRKANDLFVGKFLAFKTPLSSKFNEQVPEECRFTPQMLFSYVKQYKVKLGLWVDLTNTTRFYDKKEIEDAGCKYIKLQCRGHGETPSKEQTKIFIELVDRFIRNNPLDSVGVHCTHGFNRTGFLLVSYMVEKMDCSVEASLREFERIRSPGIYKEDYIKELFVRYDDAENAPEAPGLPNWHTESDDTVEDVAPSDSKGSSGSHGKYRQIKKDAMFAANVQGVTHFVQQPKLMEIQKLCQKMCRWSKSGFPGSQPVSMDMHNIGKLHEKPYRVSWKADGTRYLMLIVKENEIYLFDRDYCAFKVSGFRFPSHSDPHAHLFNTLVDGELVIDKEKDTGRDIPRYLCYDIITLNGEDVSQASFFPVRMTCIQKEIIGPRQKAMFEGRIKREREPFSIRIKDFWDLTKAKNLLSEKFAKTLLHEPDGLIFQPSKDPYVPGRCDDVLKWKPLSLNSIDFRLKIVKEEGIGIVPRTIGQLYVGQLEQPFAKMKYTKALENLNNKIIECKYENSKWVFMRERTDKSYPNSYTTAQAVAESIAHPVTQEALLDFIDHHRFHDDSEMMPPPKIRRM